MSLDMTFPSTIRINNDEASIAPHYIKKEKSGKNSHFLHSTLMLT